MDEGRQGHVSRRFERLLALYRKPDGSIWGGQDLQNATGGAVTRGYVTNLKKGRIEHPGMYKLEALASAMGFPPALWFGDVEERASDAALVAAGAVVVSGLAGGVDAAAHEGALAGGGETVGVLGCGIDVAYPSEYKPSGVEVRCPASRRDSEIRVRDDVGGGSPRRVRCTSR